MSEKKWITFPVDIPTLDQMRLISFEILLFAKKLENDGMSAQSVKELRVASTYINKALKRVKNDDE